MKVNTDLKIEKLKIDLISTLAEPEDWGAKERQTSFDNLSKKFLAFVEESKLVAQQQIILRSLLFEQIFQREENIKDAHQATLDWMFEKNETKFMNWLETGKGIYWVRGKVRKQLVAVLILSGGRIPN